MLSIVYLISYYRGYALMLYHEIDVGALLSAALFASRIAYEIMRKGRRSGFEADIAQLVQKSNDQIIVHNRNVLFRNE